MRHRDALLFPRSFNQTSELGLKLAGVEGGRREGDRSIRDGIGGAR
jgi:hypothetical protein